MPPGLLSRWMSRPNGEMTFHPTQLMTGYGSFNRFLHRIDHPDIPTGEPGEEDKALHTFTHGEAFEGSRERLVWVIGTFDLRGLVSLMLESRANWKTVARYATYVMTIKEDVERIRQSLQGSLLVRRARRTPRWRVARRLVLRDAIFVVCEQVESDGSRYHVTSCATFVPRDCEGLSHPRPKETV